MDQANQNPKGRSTFVPATRAPTPPPVAGRRRGALTSREVSVQATWKRPPNPRDDDRAIKKLRIDTTLAGTQRQHGTPGTDAGRSKPSIQGHSVAAGSMKKLGSLAFAKPVHIPGARSGGTPQPVNASSADPTRRSSAGGGAGLSTSKGISWAPLLQQQQQQQQTQGHDQPQEKDYTPTPTPTMSSNPAFHHHGPLPPPQHATHGLAHPQPSPIYHTNIPNPSPSPSLFPSNPAGATPPVGNRAVNYTNLLFDTQRPQHRRTPSNSSNPNPSWRYNMSPHEQLPASVAEVLSPTRLVPSTKNREDSVPAPGPEHGSGSGFVYGHYGPYGHTSGQGHGQYTSGAPFNPNQNPYPNPNAQMAQGAATGYFGLEASTSGSAYMHHQVRSQARGQSGGQPVEDKPIGVGGNGQNNSGDDKDKHEDKDREVCKDPTFADNNKGKKRERTMDEATYELLVQLVEHNRELRTEVAEMRRDYMGMRREMTKVSETLGVEDVSDSEDERPGPASGVALTSTSTSALTLAPGSTGAAADTAIDVDALPAAPSGGAESAPADASGSSIVVQPNAKRAKPQKTRRTILERLEIIEQDVAECIEGLRDPEANMPPIDPGVNPSVGSVAANADVSPRATREMGIRTSLPPASPPSASNIFTFGPATASSAGIPASFPFTFNWPRGAIIDVRLPTPGIARPFKDNDVSNNPDNDNVGKPLIRVHGAGSKGVKFLEMARMLLGDGHVELVEELNVNINEDQSDGQGQEPVEGAHKEGERREEDEAPLEKQTETEGEMEAGIKVVIEVEKEKETWNDNAKTVVGPSEAVANNLEVAVEPDAHPEGNSTGGDFDIIMGDGDNGGAAEANAALGLGTTEEETVDVEKSTLEPVETVGLHGPEAHQVQTGQIKKQGQEEAEQEIEQDAVEFEHQPEADTTEQPEVDPPVVPQDEPIHVQDIVSLEADAIPKGTKEASLTPVSTDPTLYSIKQKPCEEATVETEPAKETDASTGQDLSLPLSPVSTCPVEDEHITEDLSAVPGEDVDAETETDGRDDKAGEEDVEDAQMDLSPEELAIVTEQSRGIMFAVRSAEATSSGRTSASPAIPPAPPSTFATTSLSLSTSASTASSDPLPETRVPLFDRPSVGSGEATEDEISNWSETPDEERLGSVEAENAAPVSSTTTSSSTTLVSGIDAESSHRMTPIPETAAVDVSQEITSSLVVSNAEGPTFPVGPTTSMTGETSKHITNDVSAGLWSPSRPGSLPRLDLRTIPRGKSRISKIHIPAPDARDYEEVELEDTPTPKFTPNVDWSKTTPTKTSGAVAFTPIETRVLRSGRATPIRPGTPLSLGGSKTPTRTTTSSSSMTPTAQSAPIAASVASTPSSSGVTTPTILESSKPSTSKLSPREKTVRATAERAIEGLLRAQARSPDKDFSIPIGRKTPTPSPSKPPLNQPKPSPMKTYLSPGPSEGTVASLRQQLLGNNHIRSNVGSKPSNRAADKVVAESVRAEFSTTANAEVIPEQEQEVDMDTATKIATPPPVSLPATVTEKDESVKSSSQLASHAPVPAPEEVKIASPHQRSITPQEPLSQAPSTAPPLSLTSLTSQASFSALDEEDVENQLMDAASTSPVRQETAKPRDADIEMLFTPIASAKASTGRLRPKPRSVICGPIADPLTLKKPSPAPEVIYIESSPEKTPKKPFTRSTRNRKSSSQPAAHNVNSSTSASVVHVKRVISIDSSSDDALPAPLSIQIKGKQRESIAALTPKTELNAASIQSGNPEQPLQKLESSKEVAPVSASGSKSIRVQLTGSLSDMSDLSDVPDDSSAPVPVSARRMKGQSVLELASHVKKPTTAADSDSDSDDHIIVKKKRVPSGTIATTADGSAAAGTVGGLKKTSLLMPAKKGQSAAATRVVRKRKRPMDPDAEENMPPLKRAAIRAASRALEGTGATSALLLKDPSLSKSTSMTVSAPASSSGSSTALPSGSVSGSVQVKEKSRVQGKLARPSPSKKVKVELLSENGRTPTRTRPARTATVTWPPIPVPNLTESIECDLCNQWYHWGCAGVNANDPRIQSSEIYKCPPCEEGISANGSPMKKAGSNRECARPKCPTILAASKKGKAKKSSELFAVESFVGKRKLMISGTPSAKVQFLVKWLDWPFAHNTWETEEDLKEDLSNADVLINTFKQQASKEDISLEELSWNEPVYLSEAVKAGWGPNGEFAQP